MERMMDKLPIIQIRNGLITRDGQPIGSAEIRLKHGYHPVSVLNIEVNKKMFVQEFEMDETMSRMIRWVLSVV